MHDVNHTQSALTSNLAVIVILSLIKQVDKTQPYKDNKKLINVFEKKSINIVSGIDLQCSDTSAMQHLAATAAATTDTKSTTVTPTIATATTAVRYS